MSLAWFESLQWNDFGGTFEAFMISGYFRAGMLLDLAMPGGTHLNPFLIGSAREVGSSEYVNQDIADDVIVVRFTEAVNMFGVEASMANHSPEYVAHFWK